MTTNLQPPAGRPDRHASELAARDAQIVSLGARLSVALADNSHLKQVLSARFEKDWARELRSMGAGRFAEVQTTDTLTDPADLYGGTGFCDGAIL